MVLSNELVSAFQVSQLNNQVLLFAFEVVSLALEFQQVIRQSASGLRLIRLNLSVQSQYLLCVSLVQLSQIATFLQFR